MVKSGSGNLSHLCCFALFACLRSTHRRRAEGGAKRSNVAPPSRIKCVFARNHKYWMDSIHRNEIPNEIKRFVSLWLLYSVQCSVSTCGKSYELLNNLDAKNIKWNRKSEFYFNAILLNFPFFCGGWYALMIKFQIECVCFALINWCRITHFWQ